MFIKLFVCYILGLLYINYLKNDFVMFNYICCYDNYMIICVLLDLFNNLKFK